MAKKVDVNKESIKIISVAAFCFSIVSCITTATGLGEFVFEDKQAWQAAIISFSIQSILFVFNLRLPGYFAKINGNIRTKINILRPIKLLILDIVFVALYVLVLLASSLFSFVYIFDASYLSRDISYIDADVILTSEYNKEKRNYDDYINEEIKAIEINMCLKIIRLQDILPPTDSEASDYNLLEDSVSDAEANIDLLNVEIDRKNDEIKMYEGIRDDYPINIFGITPQYTEAIEKLEQANLELTDLKTQKIEADSELKKAQKALDNYSKPKEDSAKAFLVKLLQNDINSTSKETVDYLEQAMSELTNMVENYVNDASVGDSYGEMVQVTQSLNMTKEEYITLQKLISSTSISGSDVILLPDISNKKDIERWKNEWKLKFEELSSDINNVPTYIGLDNDDYSGKDIIDEELLNNYDPIKATEQLDDYKREYLTDINIIEKSWGLLIDVNGRYPFNVRFSAIFAVFLDISSLAVGMFIYYFELNQTNTSNNTTANP